MFEGAGGQAIPLDLFGFACALGGPDGRTLFMVANEWNGYENIGKGPRTEHVYTVEVAVPAGDQPLSFAAHVTSQLDRLLADAADDATRRHWEGYLKGAATFRGVPMARIRKIVRQLWRDHALGDRPVEELLALSHRWFARPASEDKLAAVLLIAEHLESRLELFHHPDLAQPLEAGDIADWNVCDWYATKALHGYLSGADDVEARARAIAAWTLTDRLWQRRAGLVAFVRLAPIADRQFDGFIPLILEACAANLVSDDRFAHTGPGWVLRELSVVAPEAVTRFVEDHPELSTEGRRMATARLRSGTYRRR